MTKITRQEVSNTRGGLVLLRGGYIEKRIWPYEVSKTLSRTLCAKSGAHYRSIVRDAIREDPTSEIARLPLRPETSYKNSGFTWADYLGSSYNPRAKIAPKCVGYDMAREIIAPINLRTKEEYDAFWKAKGRYLKLPKDPGSTYRKGPLGGYWKGWDAFLWLNQSPNLSLKTGYELRVLSFEEARELCRSLGIRSAWQYRRLNAVGKLPKGLPSRPERVYETTAHGSKWKGWKDFLGSSFKPKRGVYQSSDGITLGVTTSYGQAVDMLAPFGFLTKSEYERAWKAGRLPDGLPLKADLVFSGRGWEGWDEYLSVPRNLRKWLRDIDPNQSVPYLYRTSRGGEIVSCEAAIQLLCYYQIETASQYRKLVKSGLLPQGVPLYPELIYLRHEYGGGWPGWDYYLSKGQSTRPILSSLPTARDRRLIRKLAGEKKEVVIEEVVIA